MYTTFMEVRVVVIKVDPPHCMSLAGRVVRIMLCMQDCKTSWHYRLNFVPFVHIQVCSTFVNCGEGGRGGGVATSRMKER